MSDSRNDSLQDVGMLPAIEMTDYLDHASARSFSRVSQFFNRHTALVLGVRRLCHYVVRDDLNAARQLITEHPRLLIHRAAYVVTPRGVVYRNITALECALREHGDRMIGLLSDCFINVLREPGWRMQQVLNVFPGEKVSEQVGFNFDHIATMISNADESQVSAVLNNEISESPLCHALRDFKAAFTACWMSEETVNENHFRRAIETHDRLVQGWTHEQQSLYLIRVFGAAQRALSAVYAKELYRGVHANCIRPTVPRRDDASFMCNENNVHFYLSKLGEDFYINSSGKCARQEINYGPMLLCGSSRELRYAYLNCLKFIRSACNEQINIPPGFRHRL